MAGGRHHRAEHDPQSRYFLPILYTAFFEREAAPRALGAALRTTAVRPLRTAKPTPIVIATTATPPQPCSSLCFRGAAGAGQNDGRGVSAMPKSRKTQRSPLRIVAAKDWRRLGLAVLAALVLLDLVVKHYRYFAIDGTFGFAAWFGALACAALIVLALAIGSLLHRPERTYDD